MEFFKLLYTKANQQVLKRDYLGVFSISTWSQNVATVSENGTSIKGEGLKITWN